MTAILHHQCQREIKCQKLTPSHAAPYYILYVYFCSLVSQRTHQEITDYHKILQLVCFAFTPQMNRISIHVEADQDPPFHGYAVILFSLHHSWIEPHQTFFNDQRK